MCIITTFLFLSSSHHSLVFPFHPVYLFLLFSFIPLPHSLLHTDNLKISHPKEFNCSVFLGQDYHNLDCLTLEAETDKLSLEECTDRLSRKVRNQLPTYDV